MNKLKKFLGIIWIGLGILAVYYLFVNQAIGMWKAGGEKFIPAAIYTFVLCPMIAGALGTFGLYCLQDEFEEK
jgi:hypothetical protein